VIPAGFGGDCNADQLEVALQDLDAEFQQRVDKAAEKGCVLRYVGEIIEAGCQVKIVEVDANNPLYPIRDGENALAMHSKYYSPLPMVLRGYGAGATVTAAGVFADLLRTLRQPALR